MKAKTYAYLLTVLTAARRALNDGETLKSIKENLFARLADVPQTFADLENLGSVDSSRCLTVYAALAEYSRKAPLSLHLDREIAFLQEASKEPAGMTAARLAELFRDWMNNFLSVERFAEHYGLTVEQAHDVIKRGKAHHDEAARQTSASAPAPRTYASRQSALDSGDYDNYGALAGSLLEKDIRTGHAVIKAPAPASTALTVICGTDTREGDDPVVMFIDAAAPEDVRAAVEAEYKRTLGEWAEDGGVILGIMRGHIQLGWSGYNGGNGLPDHTIADAFNNFGVKP